jgi:hypothetical protein
MKKMMLLLGLISISMCAAESFDTTSANCVAMCNIQGDQKLTKIYCQEESSQENCIAMCNVHGNQQFTKIYCNQK